MNEPILDYLVGHINGGVNQLLCIIFTPSYPEEGVLVSVMEGVPYHSNGPSLSPQKILEFRPHIFHDEVINGEFKMVGMEQEPPGWFCRKCEEANCSWFYPMVERMARGEDVPLEEIQAAYREYNEGREMLKGKWGSPFPF